MVEKRMYKKEDNKGMDFTVCKMSNINDEENERRYWY